MAHFNVGMVARFASEYPARFRWNSHNGQISFSPPDESFSLTVAMTNITNEVVFQSLRISASGTDGILEKPREVKATIRINF